VFEQPLSEADVRLACAEQSPLLTFLLVLRCSTQILHALLPLSLLPWPASIPTLLLDRVCQAQNVWARLPDLYLLLWAHLVPFVLTQLALSADLTWTRSPQTSLARKILSDGERRPRRELPIVIEEIAVVV